MVTKVTDQSFASFINSNKAVLLDFTASWCPPCKLLSPILDELSAEVPKISIGKIDVDENPVTTGKYGVMSMPTMLLFKNGEVVGQTVGLRPKSEIARFLSQVL